jgi:hypothetical protein
MTKQAIPTERKAIHSQKNGERRRDRTRSMKAYPPKDVPQHKVDQPEGACNEHDPVESTGNVEAILRQSTQSQQPSNRKRGEEGTFCLPVSVSVNVAL